MKNIIKGFGFVLALVATSAQAIPTLFFDGDISFDSTSGELSVTSVLTATSEIAPAPNLLGSSLDFSALLTSVDASNTYYTIGNFGTTAGDDLLVLDGDANNLLTGNFSYLQMKGANDFSSGLVSGLLNASGGSLADQFGLGNLIALEFNLSTAFSSTMFMDNFSGSIDGRIEGETAVPEPTMPALLAMGILLIGFAKRVQRRI